ncbi:MAG TPA: dienelactone hydrolase family protein [Solirubrobacteraceae bacterium]
MPIQTRSEPIAMPGGGDMEAYVALPASGRGPGLLVLMEIFGVGTYIRRAAERLAELGYVALAPDLYRRTAPGAEFDHDQAGLQQAFAAMSELDLAGAVEDSVVALDHLRQLPEVTPPIVDHLRHLPEVAPPVGVLGFCLGGALAFEVAIASDPALAVCYYGSGVADALSRSDRITCPVLFHFGAEDQYIALEDAQRVCDAAEQRPGWECHIQPDAGHAFDNHDSEMFHRPEPAARAWALTSGFLARELPAA